MPRMAIGGAIAVGLLLLAFSGGARPPPVVRPPPTIEPEYPPITVTGFLTFDEWQALYGPNSENDYNDWLRGL